MRASHQPVSRPARPTPRANLETIFERLLTIDRETDRRLAVTLPDGLSLDQLQRIASVLADRTAAGQPDQARRALASRLDAMPARPWEELARPSLSQLSRSLGRRSLLRA